jgi:hypothetical protein
MKKLLLLALTCAIPACAQTPDPALFSSCAQGVSVNGIALQAIPFTEITEEDNYAHGYSARYTVFNKAEIGYAKKGDAEAAVYNKRAYPISQAASVNVPASEYKSMESRGELTLNQPADWYLLTDKSKKKYVCIALNRSMEKAIPLMYLLPISTKPGKLFFSAGY